MSENAEPKGPSQHKSQTRSDALANQERLLAAAVTAMLREGRQVPMASIARDAGVGIATLYRNYPTREALLEALTERSFGLVLDVVKEAAVGERPAIGAIEAFLTSTIAHREQLVLPLHGGPDDLSDESRRLRTEIHAGIARILDRGRDDLTVRTDITASDVVFFGAMLAQPLSKDDGWLEANLLRQERIFLGGLAPVPPVLDII
ncbi:transcriptional regulator, TetR family [Brevibacterium sp. 239c]|uniref:TetR/AcrR family transcriptional regulator n=1 Tax=Brevibacterium sp. 239c TaxID=1965356 RepID=UPI000C59BBF5|nr:TetR/AcrR family transcriptional regulator [Brevibacterium sp. 239c]SMY03592.1 transcriptional regulator, TetR family [Brevibacterium sp. 239c]